MSQADLKALAADLGAIAPPDVRPPGIPVGVYVHQGQLILTASVRDRAELLAAGVKPVDLDTLEVRLGGLTTADAEWQVYRFQGRPPAQVALEQTAFMLRDDTVRSAQWGLREQEAAQASIARIQEGDGLVDCLKDLEELAALLRKEAAHFDLPGFDAPARATECEQTAATVHKGSAEWKLDETQARLQDRRDRAFTLVDKPITT
ncbi:MAG: hypothetical protein HY906_08825, partial [Deltaproteobacteria bacterium]|nr:hypothetical protein [Deltaproteobacteria bacterium]